jgi:large-conductance mechanosensitive channel
MIEIILISSFFIVSLLIFIIIMVFDIKKWSQQRDNFYMEKHNTLQSEINQLREIFVSEISDTLEQIKTIIK